MYIVMGATGHVGSAVAKALLQRGEPVTAITRNADHATQLERQGAKVAVADLHDIPSMRKVFSAGRRLFLLNPPAAPDTDTDAVERETIRYLLQAVEGSGLEKIVAQSTYGARPGEGIGDFTTLYTLEQGLVEQPIPHAILRAAYHMSNWDAMLEPARSEGILPTMLPAEQKLPMVAPEDIGTVAAGMLCGTETGTFHVEGPERYSPSDVAEAFAAALGRPVTPAVTPREGWIEAYRALGFSEKAARSYTRMTEVSADWDIDSPDPIRGKTTLKAYVDRLVAAGQASG